MSSPSAERQTEADERKSPVRQQSSMWLTSGLGPPRHGRSPAGCIDRKPDASDQKPTRFFRFCWQRPACFSPAASPNLPRRQPIDWPPVGSARPATAIATPHGRGSNWTVNADSSNACSTTPRGIVAQSGESSSRSSSSDTSSRASTQLQGQPPPTLLSPKKPKPHRQRNLRLSSRATPKRRNPKCPANRRLPPNPGPCHNLKYFRSQSAATIS